MGESMLPEAFLVRMQQMLGEEYEAFLETFAQERHQALRINVLKLRSDRILERANVVSEEADEVQGKMEVNSEEADEVPEKMEVDSEEANEVPGKIEVDSEEVNEVSEGTDICGINEIMAVWKPHLSKVPWAENGYYYEAEDFPGKHPYHDAGVYYIQEPSAMMPAELLAVQPGERVLDLCAAPGGKSTQIAARMRGKGILFCNEIHSVRAKVLSENIERMGISNACVLNETPERLAEGFPEYFDRILVDAPCSGEGMFRKNDAACEEWSPENVAMCAHRQDGILDCAARMLRPGGRLVYSTCTFAPEENEGSVSRFVRRHEEFEIVNISPMEKERRGVAGCDGKAEYLDDPVPGLEGTLRLWPHRIKGEGHYVAVLQKAENRQMGGQNRDVKGSIEGVIRKIPEEFLEFVCENLRSTDMREKNIFKKQSGKGNRTQADMEGMLCALGKMTGLVGKPQMVGFGDNLYLVAEGMPSLNGLKVLRPGLHLGELRKNRFEPSHALALALKPSQAVHRWNLDSDGQRILAYLNGEIFPADGEKGWYLICVDGFGIGWGKLAGGMMKNHYPRGLRGKSR